MANLSGRSWTSAGALLLGLTVVGVLVLQYAVRGGFAETQSGPPAEGYPAACDRAEIAVTTDGADRVAASIATASRFTLSVTTRGGTDPKPSTSPFADALVRFA